ncbi:MAG: hypothetical protein EHM70_11880 [Chloroflexota bacterium]|nr:MAG: hypothetical protein EHM70_11880 [Chloroflexota bacterium]
MKIKLFSVLAILAIALAGFGPSTAVAQSPAYDTAFTTSITYQNVDTAATTSLHILFYADQTSTTPIDITRPNLAAGAGTSVYIGDPSLPITDGFRGSAVMQADKLLVATLVQVPQSTTVKNRPLSNGFASGAPTALIATVLKNTFNSSTLFSVQNTDTVANVITVRFYNTSAAQVHSLTATIQAGASYYVDAGEVAELGTSFNGSVVVDAKRSDGTTNGSIVATAMELSTNANAASAFEGVAAGGTVFYMPAALCGAFGGQNTAYAVQNTSLTGATNVTVTYSNGATETKLIGAGSKQSFVACNASGMTSGFSGSATITSDTTAIIAIGKAYGLGLSTAFLGAATGAAKLALPYVRWSQSQYTTGARQRSNIAIQNIGDAAIPAGGLLVDYYDKTGALVFTHTVNPTAEIAIGAKANSNPYVTQNAAAAEFGYYTDNTFGGSAVVRCTAANCEIVAVVRVSSISVATAETVAEDYNGIPVP